MKRTLKSIPHPPAKRPLRVCLGRLAPLAMLAAAGGAQAQTASSVTLYGHLDTGIEHLTNVQGGGSLTRMPGLTGTAPSRWGLRGSEDLGGGLSAVFALESGFGPDAGTFNQGGRGFGRQAWVGLSGGWGSVSLGRNYTMLYWALFDADLLGPNAFGLSSLDSYIPNTRTDNSLAYRGRFGAWSLGAAYSLGRDAVNAGPSPAGTNCAGESATDRQACRQWSAMLKYDTAPWGFALAVDEMRGGAGAFAGLTRSDLKDRRIMLNGYAALSPTIKLGAGLMRGAVMGRGFGLDFGLGSVGDVGHDAGSRTRARNRTASGLWKCLAVRPEGGAAGSRWSNSAPKSALTPACSMVRCSSCPSLTLARYQSTAFPISVSSITELVRVSVTRPGLAQSASMSACRSTVTPCLTAPWRYMCHWGRHSDAEMVYRGGLCPASPCSTGPRTGPGHNRG